MSVSPIQSFLKQSPDFGSYPSFGVKPIQKCAEFIAFKRAIQKGRPARGAKKLKQS